LAQLKHAIKAALLVIVMICSKAYGFFNFFVKKRSLLAKFAKFYLFTFHYHVILIVFHFTA